MRLDMDFLKIPDLEVPVLMRSTYTDHSFVRERIEAVLSRGQAGYQTKISSRLFLNGGTRDDLSEMVVNNPKPENEDLFTWLRTVTSSEHFCLALNGLNSLDEPLDELLANSFNNAWIDQIGLTMGGIDVYAFIGKYPMTPFGIHTDREHTFLFHLGPGTKEAWLWYPGQISDIVGGTQRQFLFKEIEPLAQHFVLNPGDILFIPAGHYHVLANPEFSATLGIAPYEKPLRSILNEAISNRVSEFVGEIDLPLSNVKGALDTASKAAVVPPIDVSTLMAEYIQHEERRLRSSRGMKFRRAVTTPELTPATVLGRSEAPLIMEEGKIPDTANIYARGHVFDVSSEHVPTLRAMFARLEAGDHTIADLLSDEEADEDLCLSTIHSLCRVGAIAAKA